MIKALQLQAAQVLGFAADLNILEENLLDHNFGSDFIPIILRDTDAAAQDEEGQRMGIPTGGQLNMQMDQVDNSEL